MVRRTWRVHAGGSAFGEKTMWVWRGVSWSARAGRVYDAASDRSGACVFAHTNARPRPHLLGCGWVAASACAGRGVLYKYQPSVRANTTLFSAHTIIIIIIHHHLIEFKRRIND